MTGKPMLTLKYIILYALGKYPMVQSAMFTIKIKKLVMCNVFLIHEVDPKG